MPFGGPLHAFQQEMNRLFDQFFGMEPISRRPLFGAMEEGFAGSFPALDIKETDKGIRVTAELPGVNEKDIQLSICGNSLTIKGEKREEKEEKEANYFRTERHYGAFSRVVPLPEEVEMNKVEATFKNGLLEIELPKSEKVTSQKKKIEIKTAKH